MGSWSLGCWSSSLSAHKAKRGAHAPRSQPPFARAVDFWAKTLAVNYLRPSSANS